MAATLNDFIVYCTVRADEPITGPWYAEAAMIARRFMAEQAESSIPYETMAMLPPDPPVNPHPFVGRPDRWCEECKRPDRNPIHRAMTPDEVMADYQHRGG